MSKRLKMLLTAIVTVVFVSFANADSWIDPEWKEMIYGSDVIALVEYSSRGDFRAKAKVLKTYKGNLDTEEIWISGFSNRYGPIDTVNPGDKYIVFLNFFEPSEKTLAYWQDQVNENLEEKGYLDALKSGNAYYVWTPTSGDLKVKRTKVQYNLLQTTFSNHNKFYNLREFEEFLYAFSTNKRDDFYKETLAKIKTNRKSQKSEQYIMMLFLSGFQEYRSIFGKLIKLEDSEINYALAKLLGQIDDKRSQDILIRFLGDKNSIVQGEAVRQLSDEPPSFIGPILLDHLNTSNQEGLYPSNIMNPVLNKVDGGKIEIIRTLGNIKYKPAIKHLLPLLETDNDYLFNLTIGVLNQLDSKDYIPYINKHLENGTRNLILDICFIISKNNLVECVPSLMKFIANHDKSLHPSMEYTISIHSGLAKFSNEKVKDFLYTDFLKVLEMPIGSTIDNKKDWIEEYIEVFTELEIIKAKPLLYDSMYDYFGLSSEFKDNPQLFEVKKGIEDSLSNRIKTKVIDDNIKPLEAFVFLSKNQTLENYTVKIKVSKSDEFNRLFSKFESYGFPKENVILTTGASTHTYGARPIRRFGDALMTNFLSYIATFPDQKDLEFLLNLKRYKYYSSEYELNKLNNFIEKAKKNLD